MEAGEHDPLHAESGVSNTAVPGVALVLEVDGDVHFNLIFLSEALLVNDVGFYSGSALSVGSARDYDLIFRISLFGDDSARQVQLTARPPGFSAEASHIPDDRIDLRGAQGFAERGHDLRESARGAAVNDNGLPSGVWLRGGLIAASEIRKGSWLLEPRDGLGRASTVGPMTGDASGFVDLFTGLRGDGGVAIHLRRSAQRGSKQSGGEDNADATKMSLNSGENGIEFQSFFMTSSWRKRFETETHA